MPLKRPELPQNIRSDLGLISFLLFSQAFMFEAEVSSVDSFGFCRTGILKVMYRTSFGFAQNTIHDFQNTVLNSTNATKKA